MLLELRDRLREGGPQSLSDLEVQLRLPEAVVRDMLARWMAKGKVERIDLAPSCAKCASRGQCAGVGVGCFELYRWVDESPAAADATSACSRQPAGEPPAGIEARQRQGGRQARECGEE